MPSKKAKSKKNEELQTAEELGIRQVDALAQLGKYAVEGRPLEEVVHRGMHMICEILEPDNCLLLKLNRNQNKLQIEEAVGVNAESVEDLEIYIDEKWQAASSLDRMESTIIKDFNTEERFSPAPILIIKK